MENTTFLFMDYETFNINPKGGRASQFAAIRTDNKLNYIPQKAINIFCEQSMDNIPSPKAALITKITPAKIDRIKHNVEVSYNHTHDVKATVHNEYDFSQIIHREMTYPGTCTLGYNSLKFDDEFTRNLLYRNLFDPYEREWKNGNSRFDVYHLVLATFVLNPSYLNFPNAKDNETKQVLIHPVTHQPLPSFKLEELSVANGIIHQNAHDAFSDVEATVQLMKKIKDQDEFFFNEFFALRNKNNVAVFIANSYNKPFICISPYFGRENYSFALVYTIYQSDRRAICINLNSDIEPLISLEVEELKEHFNNKDVKIKNVVFITFNQCPILAKIADYSDRIRSFNLDKTKLENNLKLLREKFPIIRDKITEIYKNSFENIEAEHFEDTDMQIYSGGFFSQEEKKIQAVIHDVIKQDTINQLNDSNFPKRIKEMFFKIKGRNFQDKLSPKDKEAWFSYCSKRITDKQTGAELSIKDFKSELIELRKTNLDHNDNRILNELELFVKNNCKTLNIDYDTIL